MHNVKFIECVKDKTYKKTKIFLIYIFCKLKLANSTNSKLVILRPFVVHDKSNTMNEQKPSNVYY